MNITVVIRPRGASSGGDVRDIPGEGTISDYAEAQAALAALGSGDNVIMVGSDIFDRTRLERIRDGQGASAPAPVGGQGGAAGGELRIGTIRTSENIPAGSRLYIFIDGNPVGGGIEIPPDRATPVTIPASTPDGPHEVQYRISRPNMAEVRYTRIVTIRPAIATLSNASVLPPSSGTSFAREQIRVRFTTSMAGEHRVRVSVGTRNEIITVPAGSAGREHTATLSGEPRTWTDTGGVPDRRTNRYTVPVTVTPLGAAGANPERTGTTVNAGSVTVTQLRQRARSSGPARPAPAPRVARPLP